MYAQKTRHPCLRKLDRLTGSRDEERAILDDIPKNCLLEAFEDGQIPTAAKYYMKNFNGTLNKDMESKREIDYRYWCTKVDAVELEFKAYDDDPTYKLIMSYTNDDGGEICRTNWCWLHNMSQNSVKKIFPAKYKAELRDRFHQENKCKKVTDNTYFDVPYKDMKAIYEEMGIPGSIIICFQLFVISILILLFGTI